MNVLVYDNKGALCYSNKVTVVNGIISIPLEVAKGIYFVKISNNKINKVVKIFK